MKVVKEGEEYTVYQKRSGRYAVKGADSKWINEDEKVKVLLAEGLIVVPELKAVKPEAAEPEAPESEEVEVEPQDEVEEEKAEVEESSKESE